MKRIYNIIILFTLFCGVLFAHERHEHNSVLAELHEVNFSGLKTQVGEYCFSITALYDSSRVKSAESRQLVTYSGWFHDWHCAWNKTPNTVDRGSCSIACGTGGDTGQSMLAGCQAYGHGIWVNPTDTTTANNSNDGHFLNFDAVSAELLKAFLLTLPSEASGKLSLEVSGYRVKIPAKDVEVNDITRKFTPVVDGTGTYETNGFHVVSIKGAVIDEGKSFAGFADNDYKLTLDALTPKNVQATGEHDNYSITFDAPISNTAKSPKFGVKGYDVIVYKDYVPVDTVTVENNPDAPLTSIPVSGLEHGDNYTFSLVAHYTASNVLSAESRQLVTYSGWFHDWHCAWNKTPNTVDRGSCSIACGTGGDTGQSMLAGCQAYGHGIWVNPTDTTTANNSNDGHFLNFDAVSAELLKAFLLTLPSEASGKLSLEVSGYRVKIPAKDVEVNDVTRKFTPVVDGTGTYETDGFHVVSIKGAVIDEGKSFAGFADNDYALSIDSLIPQNVVATEINGIYSVTFNAPVSNTAKSPKFGVKAYELAIYKDGVLASTQKVDNDPAAPITEIQIPELARDTLSFHLYTVDGKIYEGHTEVFIALKDKDGNLVEDFTVSNLAPLMDMGSMSHSTPIGKVEKVEGQPLYKTWIAGLMDGDWELAFGYVIEGTPGKITGAAFAVTPNPEGVKWIQSFGTRLYASIAYPQSYTDEGAQVLQAYINRNEVGTEPYQIVEGGYKIVVTPNFGATTLPVDTLLWNAEKGIYEGNSVTFTEEGLWTLYFKVLDAATNELITGGGSDGTESNRFWKINVVDGSGAGIRQITGGSEVKVYPTLTQGDVTVEVPADATVNVFAINGERLQSHNAKAAAPLTLNISRKGLYLINIQTVTGEVVTRKVIVK